MQKLTLLVVIFLFLGGACGGWVKDYDRKANRSFYADIIPMHKEEIFSTLKKLAKEHKLEIVVQRKDDFAPNRFNVLMRNKEFSVNVTNFPSDHLHVFFYKAVSPEWRPSDDELNVIVHDFMIDLDELPSVSIITE